MTYIKEILKYLTDFAPLELQEGYDNAGFLCGNQERPVNKVIIALDATSDVIREATDKGAELIITHHPLIFGSITKVTEDYSTGKKLINLVKSDISVISMHTNLDKVLVNKVLIESLGTVKHEQINEFMCVGYLERPMLMDDYIPVCKDALNNSSFRYYNSGKPVYKIGCIGGAGDEGIGDAFNAGCDTFITADIRHHVFLEAKELGINLIDGDHYNTEAVVLPALKEMLDKEFPDVKFVIAENDVQVVSYA